MKNYKTFTTMTDYGPFITKLILQLPCEVTKNDLSIDSFNVYAECRDLYTGKILMKKDKKTEEEVISLIEKFLLSSEFELEI